MIHITDKAHEIAKKVNGEGFNGVYVKVKVEDCQEDHDGIVPDEMTEEEFQAWRRDYVCFTANPDYPAAISDYFKFDEDYFWDHFTNWVKSEFGADVDVTLRRGCEEFEIQRQHKE